MEFTLASLIGIALATMFFGYFFGLFEGRAQGYRRRKKEEPLGRELQPPERQTSPAPPQTPGAAQVSRQDRWLELSADQNGQPRLDLDGQPVDTTRLSGDQHRRLIQLMVLMRPWVEGGAPGAAPPSTTESLDVHARSAAATGMATAARPTPDLPMNMPSTAPGPSSPPATPDASTPASMVAQINAILQARLQATPLASRGIRLVESLDGGAVVFVGRQSYAGVADVPDPDVRSAIHAAIAEWEKKYTPG